MNSWKIILATLVIFGAGFVTGGLVMNRSGDVLPHPVKSGSSEITKPAFATNSPSPLRVLAPNFLTKKDFLERLDRELKLKADQHARIEKIISEGQERLKCLCKSIDPEVQEELAETKAKIHAELSPLQQALFADFFKRKPAVRASTNSPASLSATNLESVLKVN